MKKKRKGYVSAWYDYDAQQICLKWWRNNRVQVKRIDFLWYFYLSDSDVDEIMCPVFEGLIDGTKQEGNGWTRIYMDGDYNEKRSLASWLRKRRIEPCELDVTPINRFLTDNQIEFDPNPRTLFFDFETDARDGFGPNVPGHRILTIAHGAVGRETECMVAATDDDKGERELLLHFLNLIGDHDLLVAWNGKFYDEVVLKGRCRVLGLWPKWQMVNFLDMMALFKHSYYGYGRDVEGKGVKVSWGLDNVCKTVLGWGKLDVVQEAEDLLGKKWGGFAHMIVDIFHRARELLVKYNIRDVDAMVALEQDRGYISALTVMSHLCNRHVSDWALYIGYLNDAFILRWGHENDVHFPTKERMFDEEKPSDSKHGVKYEGAFVLEPEPGLYENVTPVDFGSLYPNIIDTFNISPETRVKDAIRIGDKKEKPKNTCVTVTGAQFSTDTLGVFPQIVRMAKERRAPYKAEAERLEKVGKEDTREFKDAKHKAQGWKLVGVGSYGVMGAPSSRYYDRECARAVTLTGRFIIQEMVIERAREEGIKPLGGDTDSAFLWCNATKARKFCDMVAGEVDEHVVMNGGRPGLIRLDLAPTYVRVFFTAKKWYAGIKVTGKLDVKGLELVRSDQCRYTREMQRRFIEYVLEAKQPNVEIAERIMILWRDCLFAGDTLVEDLVVAQSISMPLDEYASKLVHTRVAAKMVEEGREVFVGAKIPYVLIGKKDGKLEGIHADDFVGDYDAAIYWNKVWPASRRILEAVFPPKGQWKAFDKYDPRQGVLFDKEEKCRKKKRS